MSFPALDTHPANGGSPLTSIALYWDVGTNGANWAALVGETTASLVSSLIVTNVTRSGLYQFKHRAHNIFGAGTHSSVTTIKAATKPDVMVAPVTAVAAGSNVRISWVAPDDRGDTITAYIIQIQTSVAGTYVNDTTNCNGSSSVTVSNKYCDIPLATLQQLAGTNLSQGDLVVAKVQATNAYGTGSESPANTVGALIEVVPHKPNTPARGPLTHET